MSTYEAHLSAKGYSLADIETFLPAWQEMKSQKLAEEE